MKLLRTILSAPWMVDPATAQAAFPLILRMLQGEQVSFAPDKDIRPYAFSASANRKVRYYDFPNAPAGSVAVFPLIGTVTKYGDWCTMGTEELMSRMSFADEQPNIAGHLLEIDSGGGEGTNIETVTRFIRAELKKPVVAWFNGTAASAAYYIAAGADEIYASEDTDIVGSIGVLTTFADYRKFYEEKGIKIHEVYASQSDLKNQDLITARDGDYELLRANILDPYADRFIKTIQEFRPNLTKEEAYRGAIFIAPEAISIGMIDGIKTYEQAVDRVIELANQGPDDVEENDDDFFKFNNNSTSMNRIEAVLGYKLELQDGGAFLRREELLRLDRAIVAEGFEAVEQTTLEGIISRLDSVQESVNGLRTDTQRLFEMNNETAAQLNTIDNRLSAIEEQPGAAPTMGRSAGDAYEGADALAVLEAAARQARDNGTQMALTK